MKDLAIIIPCYNYGIYLEECLSSIYRNVTKYSFDVVIVDDCSTDNSVEIARNLASIYDFDLVVSNTNNKQSKTRNIGISKTNSKYIMCLDADDKIPTNYIEENIKVLERGYDISYNNSKCFGDSDIEYDWPKYDFEILRRTPFVHCSAIYKRVVWNKSKYDERMDCGWEDFFYHPLLHNHRFSYTYPLSF
jgi:glycosyltransferase involved in cell wall biosynthesis